MADVDLDKPCGDLSAELLAKPRKAALAVIPFSAARFGTEVQPLPVAQGQQRQPPGSGIIPRQGSKPCAQTFWQGVIALLFPFVLCAFKTLEQFRKGGDVCLPSQLVQVIVDLFGGGHGNLFG